MTPTGETIVVMWFVWAIVIVACVLVLTGAVLCLYADGWRSGLNLTNRPGRGTIHDTTHSW